MKTTELKVGRSYELFKQAKPVKILQISGRGRHRTVLAGGKWMPIVQFACLVECEAGCRPNRKLAAQFAAKMFTDGVGGKCERLVLMQRSPAGRDFDRGGYCEQAFADQVEALLDSVRKAEKEKC